MSNTNTNDPGEAAVPATPIEPPVAGPAKPMCKYCVWWKASAAGKLCVKCGKVYGGGVGTRSDDPPPGPPGPVPPDEDAKPRESGCQCHIEEGDSPCPVHGEDEAPGPVPPDGEPVCRCGHRRSAHINGFGQVRDCGAEGDGDFCACNLYQERASGWTAAPAKSPLSDRMGALGWTTEAFEVRALESQLATALQAVNDAMKILSGVSK